jgi:glutamate/tyrosine decarboxylase-like PLP-dependent enzyme
MLLPARTRPPIIHGCSQRCVAPRVTDARPRQRDVAEALDYVHAQARAYLDELDARPVRDSGLEAALEAFEASLPENGEGTLAALTQLVDSGTRAAVHSAGPRFFHFVIGGVTPAGLGADWLASTWDQNPGLWLGSPLGSKLEALTLGWLLDLFDLPRSWGGVLTTGATMGNFVGLAAARHWCAQRRGHDVEQTGLCDLAPIEVFSSGYIHASVVKALSMLGIGATHVHRLARDAAGRLDIGALGAELEASADSPTIVVATAGEVNAGDFDPIHEMADAADRHGAWLHVDGAFGLFARLSPSHAGLARAVDRARSVAADGHKWLNVPYDCGFAFVDDPALLRATFGMTAAYLGRGADDRPDFGFLGPESSRRARALPVWATLKAYGRSGHRAIVERHLELAKRLARRVDDEPALERLAECRLNIVCFRARPGGVAQESLDDLNRRAGELVLTDGRVYVGTTMYRGHVAFRPAIVNWRTTEADVDLLVDVLLELIDKARCDLGV